MKTEQEIKDRLGREEQLLFQLAMSGQADARDMMRTAGTIETLHWMLEPETKR